MVQRPGGTPAGYGQEVAAYGCLSDFEMAQETSSLPLDEVKELAVEFMCRPENVVAVQRISEELLKRHTLDADHVDVLVDLADGETTEDEYQRYLAMRKAAGQPID